MDGGLAHRYDRDDEAPPKSFFLGICLRAVVPQAGPRAQGEGKRAFRPPRARAVFAKSMVYSFSRAR
eukprot:9287407-Pyramimonas_sp.AAC.3